MTGDEIRQIRETRGETQKEFGAHFNVNQSTVQRWEINGISDRGTTLIAFKHVLSELRKSSGTRVGKKAPLPTTRGKIVRPSRREA